MAKDDFAFDDLVFHDCAPRDDQLVVCSRDEFRCDNAKQCIEYWKVCDGENNCDDNSDESKHCSQSNGTCWFVDENWKTFCNWIDLPEGDFNWKFIAANNETHTGPQSLFNQTFHYISMNSKGHSLGERALVASPVFPASIDICSVVFHYYMFGSPSMGEFNVSQTNEMIAQPITCYLGFHHRN